MYSGEVEPVSPGQCLSKELLSSSNEDLVVILGYQGEGLVEVSGQQRMAWVVVKTA